MGAGAPGGGAAGRMTLPTGCVTTRTAVRTLSDALSVNALTWTELVPCASASTLLATCSPLAWHPPWLHHRACASAARRPARLRPGVGVAPRGAARLSALLRTSRPALGLTRLPHRQQLHRLQLRPAAVSSRAGLLRSESPCLCSPAPWAARRWRRWRRTACPWTRRCGAGGRRWWSSTRTGVRRVQQEQNSLLPFASRLL